MKNILFYNQAIAYQFGLTFIRIFTALLMFYHGIEVFDASLMQKYATWDSIKIFPAPLLMVYLGKGIEFGAGFLLTIGLLSRLACLAIIIDMLFICFQLGHGKFWYEDQHPFLFVLLVLFLFFTGAGKFSLDEKISSK